MATRRLLIGTQIGVAAALVATTLTAGVTSADAVATAAPATAHPSVSVVVPLVHGRGTYSVTTRKTESGVAMRASVHGVRRTKWSFFNVLAGRPSCQDPCDHIPVVTAVDGTASTSMTSTSTWPRGAGGFVDSQHDKSYGSAYVSIAPRLVRAEGQGDVLTVQRSTGTIHFQNLSNMPRATWTITVTAWTPAGVQHQAKTLTSVISQGNYYRVRFPGFKKLRNFTKVKVTAATKDHKHDTWLTVTRKG